LTKNGLILKNSAQFPQFFTCKNPNKNLHSKRWRLNANLRHLAKISRNKKNHCLSYKFYFLSSFILHDNKFSLTLKSIHHLLCMFKLSMIDFSAILEFWEETFFRGQRVKMDEQVASSVDSEKWTAVSLTHVEYIKGTMTIRRQLIALDN
jgi:hypothetical protein